MRSQKKLAALGAAGVAAVAAALAVVAPPSTARAQGPTTLPGFNVCWIEGKYGQQWTTQFDPADWKRVFGRAAAAQAKIVRVFVMTGVPSEGVIWSPADPHFPVGIDPGMLGNLLTVAQIAHDNGLQIYWTFSDGWVPISGVGWPTQLDKERSWNIYNNKYGIGDLWRQNVLAPILDTIAQRPDVAWGIDAINEIEGQVERGLFANWWLGARNYMTATTTLCHAHAPGIKVSASAGWSTAPYDILVGLFDGVGLDRYDIHCYNDSGSIPLADLLVAHARSQGKTICMGEFGQISKTPDDALQAKVLNGFMYDARIRGFEAALPWRIEDETPWLTFFDANGNPRPAYVFFTWWATH